MRLRNVANSFSERKLIGRRFILNQAEPTVQTGPIDGLGIPPNPGSIRCM